MTHRLIAWALLALACLAALGAPDVAAERWICSEPGIIDPCHSTLRAVAIEPEEGEAWAVGDNGTILHWDGQSWAKQVSPTTQDLRGVVATAPWEVWAVGDEGTILRWNGLTWSGFPVATDISFRAISLVPGTGGGQAWAAGDKDGVGAFWHWNGLAWEPMFAGKAQPFFGVIHGVSMVSSQLGAAAGAKYGAAGWAGRTMRWNGAEWFECTTMPQELLAVDMLSETDAWAVGVSSALYRWTGAAWLPHLPPAGVALTGVAALDVNHAWAVGANGTILRFFAGGWSSVASLVTADLLAVAASSATEAWAVGEGGAILRWDGSAWSVAVEPAAPAPCRLRLPLVMR